MRAFQFAWYQPTAMPQWPVTRSGNAWRNRWRPAQAQGYNQSPSTLPITMPQSIGKPLQRKEDPRLLTGSGRFSDDVTLPGQAYAFVLRSPHAHARIRSIDTKAARTMPGVLAVLTGADVNADGLKDIPH